MAGQGGGEDLAWIASVLGGTTPNSGRPTSRQFRVTPRTSNHANSEARQRTSGPALTRAQPAVKRPAEVPTDAEAEITGRYYGCGTACLDQEFVRGC